RIHTMIADGTYQYCIDTLNAGRAGLLAQFVVNAFVAGSPGRTGNPASVCPLDRWLPGDVMQAIAEQNAHSETAFTVPEAGGYALRWFTPSVEVPLCGHATLASAAVLFDLPRDHDRTRLAFSTQSGTLEV